MLPVRRSFPATHLYPRALWRRWGGWRPVPLVRASIALHAMALPALLAVPGEAWGWIVAVLLANHGILGGFGLWPHSQAVGRTLVRLPPEQAQQRLVALTFDDGPDPDTTLRVLDVLDAYGARASFFCIGARAAEHPAIVREIARRGHAVENHTWSHNPVFATLGPRAMAREIQLAQAVLGRLAGARPRWVRAPAGLRSPLLDPALARTRLAHASWTRRAYDTATGDPDRVLSRLLRSLQAGDILLLHDAGGKRAPCGQPVVLAVLPRLLHAIRAAGLRAAPLPAPADLEPAGRRATAAAARIQSRAVHASR